MHLIVILVIVMIVFAPGKLPELGTDLAKGIKSFKSGIKDLKDEVNATPIEHKEGKRHNIKLTTAAFYSLFSTMSM
jgi:sec-independent protein translocase protein TatA